MGQHKFQGAAALNVTREYVERRARSRAVRSEERVIERTLAKRRRSTKGQTTYSWQTKAHTPSRIRDLPGHYPARIAYDQRKERQRKAAS